MKKELKNKIKNAFSDETPNIREDVISACERETQLPEQAKRTSGVKRLFSLRRLIAVASSLILFGAGLFIGRLIPQTQQPSPPSAEKSVYLDVNPSLTLSLDENNTVLSCAAANEDAEMLLNDMEFTGVKLKTALNAIIGAMYVNGYLTVENNSILISVDSAETNEQTTFLSYITDEVNDVFKNADMECSIIAQSVTADEDLKRRAKENGISVGKMHLVDKMIESMDDLTEEDISQLSEMPIKDLNLIYATKPNDGSQEGELISGKPEGSISEEELLNLVLTEIEKTESDVEYCHIFLLPSKHGESKAAYSVTIKLNGDETLYKYEIDYKTKAVSKIETNPPSHEPPQGDHTPPSENNSPQLTPNDTPQSGEPRA